MAVDSRLRPSGLSGAEAARRLARDGHNRIEVVRGHRTLRLLLSQFTSPIVLILIAATVLAMVLGDLLDGVIILIIVAASGALGFWQEHTAGRAVDALLARVKIKVEVLRDGREISVPADEVVVGDLVVLRAGDIIPADCRVVEAHSIQVDESALTGESFPAEKALDESLFTGTHVVSGAGLAEIVQTGRRTRYAALSDRLAKQDVITEFERGMTKFGLLLVRAMAVLVAVIFLVNLVLHRPVVEALLFSLALAVGLTPQLLPAIVAVSLSVGARRMAAEKVIVKRLDAIEDFGAITVLCTDKTGTLTVGAVRLDGAYDAEGKVSAEVLRLARLNAALQRGFANPLDDAVLAGAPPMSAESRLDEVPYDFTRKRLSVLVDDGGTATIVTKGALSNVLDVCAMPAALRRDVEKRFEKLSSDGYRVLGLAVKTVPGQRQVSVSDEAEMTFAGLLAFHDPVKPDAAQAVSDLAGLGVTVRLITGDNRLAAAHIAREVGLTGAVLTGAEVDVLTDAELSQRVQDIRIFAEVEPAHKERIVRALRQSGAAVGFLGDGINDSTALHAADVGISVDTAVDVAKQSAAIVLLDKDLSVIVDGVRLGRETFANTHKYVRVTTSANFGNMLSMAAASAFLPFLPLLPRQILLLNFLSDIPGTTIATDAVDPEQLTRPRSWDIAGIRSFMVVFGLISSVFDIATFLLLHFGFRASPDVFRTGWFIESTATELAVMLVLRTGRPFFRSRPGRALLVSSLAVAAVTLVLPYTALAGPLGLAALPASILGTLAGLTVIYVAANEIAKRVYRL